MRLSPHCFKLFLLIFVISCTTNRSVYTLGLTVEYCENDEMGFSDEQMSATFVPKIQLLLKKSMNALTLSAPLTEADELALATVVFKSMYTPGRVYHRIEHVFNITGDCPIIEEDPILTLSVLFHDVIYYSVDKVFQQSQLQLLKGVLEIEESNDGETLLKVQQPLKLTSSVQNDPILDMTVRLFGHEAGLTLPSFGTNEFLSAIIGVRVLSKWLSLTQLTQLAATIEGTIPFRPPSDDGKTAMDRLYDRLVIVAPDQSEEWLTETIHLTATMANCDLGNFDSSNFDFFLDSNWSLVPEFRPSILKEDCPLKEYHDEFLGMEGRTKWLHSIVPNIFQAFRGVPSLDEMSAKKVKARENLDLTNDYAQVRRLQAMVLMELTAYAGENPEEIPGRPLLRLDLPETRPHSEEDDDFIRKLLYRGRRTSYPWDPAKSSLGIFLYDKLGKKGVDAAVAIGKIKDGGKSDVLNHLPKAVVEQIASSLAVVWPNRSDVLLQIANTIGVSERQGNDGSSVDGKVVKDDGNVVNSDKSSWWGCLQALNPF